MIKKVLIVSPSFYPAFHYGGPIFSAHYIAKALSKEGFKVLVLTSNANGKDKLNIETNRFISINDNYLIKYHNTFRLTEKSFSLLLNLNKYIKSTDLVYLISVFSYTTPFTILLCLSKKKPIILAPKGQLAYWSMHQGSRLKKLWLKLFIQSSLSNIIWHATSEHEAKDIKLLFPNAQIMIIPLGIDLDEFKNNVATKDKNFYTKYIGMDISNKKVIVSISRIHKKKGYDILIKAIDLLKTDYQDLVLIIAGNDFGEKLNLKKLITELKLEKRIFIIDYLEGKEKISFLKNGDIFALASHDENFGVVYAEALASGLPIIASKNTPWQDVEKFNCGKWVENTPSKFAEAILSILNFDYKIMGENGKKYVASHFSCENTVEQFNKLLEKIIRA